MKFSSMVLSSLLFLCGCSSLEGLSLLRSQSPEPTAAEEAKAVREVSDLAVPFGMWPTSVEGVGLVTGLKGTGSDPKPSPQRDVLLSEMKSRGVPMPNTILASGRVSLVMVRGVLRPGIKKGDHFDVEVRVLGQSETTSLRGGYLVECSLKLLAALQEHDGRVFVHNGFEEGRAEGPVMVDPSATDHKDSIERVRMTRGKILGGGLAMKDRPLKLVLKPDHQTIMESNRVEMVVNKRFYIPQRGSKAGMATAETNQYINLKLHPRYKDNVERYMRVIGSIILKESQTERIERLRRLETQLCDPLTSCRAALALEAMGGHEAVDVLRKGIRSADREVRFYSAEALAYLDESQAAAPLGEAARDVPAFRVFALTALSAMNDFDSSEQLRSLLSVNSAETRYGAFRALWAMNPNDALIRGERLNDQFSYHILENAGPPMIHVTRSRRPEIVLFGRDQRFVPPLALEAGNQIMVTGRGGDEVVVSKFAVNQSDQERVVTTRVDDVIRTIVELGGTYPDVVQALEQAKAGGSLPSRFEIDALPQAGRVFDRVADGKPKQGGDQPPANSPVPDLFTTGAVKPEDETTGSAQKPEEKTSQSEEKPGAFKSFFARIWGSSENDKE
jgi:flagellar basal body P-ring protein FlgI